MEQRVSIPEWMLRIQFREEKPRPEAEAEFQQRLAAARVIETGFQEFWMQLLDRSNLAIAALPALGLTGWFVNRAVSAQVSVRRPHAGADFRSVNLFLTDLHTDGMPAEGERYRLTFVVSADAALAVCDQAAGGPPLNPEQAAEYIGLRLLDPWLSRSAAATGQQASAAPDGTGVHEYEPRQREDISVGTGQDDVRA